MNSIVITGFSGTGKSIVGRAVARLLDWDFIDTDQELFDPGIRLSHIGYRTVLPFVERVISGSPADVAGVRSDDLILSMNGRSIPDAPTYHDRLSKLRPGDSLDLVLQRGKAIVSVHLEPEEL